MTVTAGSVPAWGARAWIAVTVHVPHLTEKDVKKVVNERLEAAEKAAIVALTSGLAGAYTQKPEHSITVTALHRDTSGGAE